MNSENNLYDQIIDFLSTEKRPDDSKRFLEWIEASEERKETFSHVKKFWDADYSNQKQNTEAAWNQFQNTFQERNKSNIKKHLFRISVAASLLILITSGWFLNRSTMDIVSLSTNEDTFRKDTLKDGSIVYLYPSSQLDLTEQKNLSYNKEMNLIGEAFFVVSGSPEKEIIINVGEASILVKGTSFRVNAMSGGEVSVCVESGEVELVSTKTGEDKLIVKAGEKGYYSSERAQFWKQQKSDNIYLIYQPTNLN